MNKYFLLVAVALFVGCALGFRLRTATELETSLTAVDCTQKIEIPAGANTIARKMLTEYNEAIRNPVGDACEWKSEYDTASGKLFVNQRYGHVVFSNPNEQTAGLYLFIRY